MRPSSVDTSEPAWVNRKMLSMKSSTSWLCTSRKYSAIVSADRATRRRVPGGSSIWPKTRAVWPRTPASSISTIRSLPSRVRSPTPANTETPPWSRATRAIISWMSTVLPTPAPPNRPILPPCTYGVSRSMTLMPVSNIWVLDSSWSKAGAVRWIPQRSLASKVSPSARFMTSPVVLKTLPRVTSPTGTVIGPPVSCTGVPRTRPSVGCREIARTMLSPMCWATSRFRCRLSPPTSTSVVSRLYCSGMPATGNSTSTTGPMMREMRPTPPTAWVSLRSLTDAVMVSLSLALGQRAGAADDFADLLGDLGLTGLVRQAGVLLDELLGVVRGRLHRPLAGGELGRGGLEHAVEEPGVDVLGQQCVEHLLGAGLERVQRQEVVVVRARLALDDLERQQPVDLGLLGHHRDEPAEDDVHLVDPALLDGCREVVDQALAHLAGRLERGLLGVAAPLRRAVAVAELVEADRLAAEQVGNDLLALLAK